MNQYLIGEKKYTHFEWTKIKDKNCILKIYHQNKKKNVMCLCLNGNPEIPLIVAQRDDNYYLRAYPKNANKEKHAVSCIHYSFSENDSAIRGYSSKAIQENEDGDYLFSLNIALNNKPETIKESDTKATYSFSTNYKRQVSNKITLLGLLHFLWETSSLHRFDNTIMTAADVFQIIEQTAYRIKPKQFKNLSYGLNSFLLLPLGTNENQDKRNFAKLQDANKDKRHIMFLLSLNSNQVNELLSNEEKFSLTKYFGVTTSIFRDDIDKVKQQFIQSFDSDINAVKDDTNTQLILFGTAQVKMIKNKVSKKEYPNAAIKSLVAMPVVQNHISFDSKLEKKLIQELIIAKRKFEKPLRYDHDCEMKLFPDFILLDASPYCLLEVYGMNTEEYLVRKKEKQGIYQDFVIQKKCDYWEWDAIKHPDLKKFLNQYPLPAPH